ncbi:SDR family oxidoreductase [Flavobacteriaceae bacterium 3-367]|uniref:SDR family NAD(P)-dependent oxidoreductase n=1 Tax=Eudoraea algarum TaxID=3417568 RepID=UPI003290765E
MGALKDRVIIVTGATSGMGRAMAKTFAEEGASLVIAGRNRERGESLLAELQQIHPNSALVCGDIGTPDTNKELVETAVDRFGKLDTIVANAGVLGLGEVTSLSIESWHETLNTNLSSLFYLAKYALPHMLKNKFGIVLANASIAAFKAFPKHPAYCASKAAQVALIKQMAKDYGPLVRANAICPGPVDTPLIWDSAKAFEFPQEAVAQAAEATLVQRLGTPDDIAKLALFLLSENASFITGSTINIDGGIMVG